VDGELDRDGLLQVLLAERIYLPRQPRAGAPEETEDPAWLEPCRDEESGAWVLFSDLSWSASWRIGRTLGPGALVTLTELLETWGPGAGVVIDPERPWTLHLDPDELTRARAAAGPAETRQDAARP